MAAVRLVIRSRTARSWRALAALAVITALACGFVVSSVNGMRRTQTSWPRLKAATASPDALVSVSFGDVAQAVTTVAAQPGVTASGAFGFLPLAPKGGPDDVGLFAPIGPGFGDTLWRPLIIRGRRVDQGRADEITVNQAYADAAGLQVGDVVDLVGPNIEQPATVVGIHLSSLDVGPNGGAPLAMGSDALMTRWLPVISTLEGFAGGRPGVAMRFEDGTDVEAVLKALSAALPTAGVVPPAGLEADVRDGLTAGSTAYAVLAASSAIASVLLLTLLLGSATRTAGDDQRLLAALGATRLQRAIATWAPVAAAVTAGAVASPVLAWAASPAVRTGFAKVADPAGGAWVDTWAVVGAAAGLATVLLVVAGAASWRTAGRPIAPPREPVRPSALTRLVGASPAATFGVIAALGGDRRSTRRLARATLVAFGVATACVVGSLVWRSSATNLATNSRLQGWTFDAQLSGSQTALDAAGVRLRQSNVVSQVARFRQFVVPYVGVDIDVFELTDERGTFSPALLKGRAVAGRGEVVVGPVLFRQHGLEVGGPFVIDSPKGKLRMTIVGEAVFPIGNSGFGNAALVSADTTKNVDVEPTNVGLLVRLAPGASLDDLRRAAGGEVGVVEPYAPPPIVRLHDAVGTDAALSTFFWLFGVAVFGFGTVTSIARLRREYAVVRAIGFRRRQVVSAVIWQSFITMLVSAVIAVPVGVAVGRTAWTLSSRQLGVLDAFRAPVGWLGVGLIATGAVLVAGAAAAAIAPARMTIAEGLRAE